MSRIASYHDISIYTSYNKATQPIAEIKKPVVASESRQLISDTISVSISDIGKNALKNSTISSTQLKQSLEDGSRNKVTETASTDYRNRIAAQTYQQISKLK